jgi:hypothetical protein
MFTTSRQKDEKLPQMLLRQWLQATNNKVMINRTTAQNCPLRGDPPELPNHKFSSREIQL